MGNEVVKQKRISAADYWRLRDASKHADEEKKAYQKWVRTAARGEDCYLDQIQNVLTGKIVTDPTKEFPGGQVRRASDKFIQEAEPRFEKWQGAIIAFQDLCEEIARSYGITVDRLDPKTGKIMPDDCEAADKKETKVIEVEE